jgi:sugar fermentation stimulation protein A
LQCQGEYLQAIFLSRPNRFLAEVELESKKIVIAHVPDPGRLKELFISSAEVILRKSEIKKRKTQFSLIGVKSGDIWVNIDSQLSNKLFKNEYHKIPRYKNYKLIKPEFQYLSSRIDFLMENPNSNPRETLIEVKSATLVKDNTAMFPDAPTLRGARHVIELTKALNDGYNAEIVFITKRSDAKQFTPYKEMDTNFFNVLKTAKKKGVRICSIICHYDPIEQKEIKFLHEIPIVGI